LGVAKHCAHPISNRGQGKRQYQRDPSYEDRIFNLILTACIVAEPTQAFPK
jgi:hypothetical protein